jgi:hypothetical protein
MELEWRFLDENVLAVEKWRGAEFRFNRIERISTAL